MRFEYEDKNNHKYLCVTADNNEIRDDFACNMVSENDIPGILRVHFSTINGIDVYKYDVSGLIPLDVYLVRFPEYEKLVNIMSRIIKIMENLPHYVITPNGLLLSKYLVFVNESNSNIKMVYVPVKNLNPDMNGSVRTFYTSIVGNCGIANSGIKEISDYLKNSLGRKTVIEDLKHLLKKISSDSTHTAVLYSDHSKEQRDISGVFSTKKVDKNRIENESDRKRKNNRGWKNFFSIGSKEKSETNNWNTLMNHMNIPG